MGPRRALHCYYQDHLQRHLLRALNTVGHIHRCYSVCRLLYDRSIPAFQALGTTAFDGLRYSEEVRGLYCLVTMNLQLIRFPIIHSFGYVWSLNCS